MEDGHRDAKDPVEALRMAVSGPHNCKRFAERVELCTALAENYPSEIARIGVFRLPDRRLAVDCKALAVYLRIKEGSIRRNLRDHNYVLDPKADPAGEVLEHRKIYTRTWAVYQMPPQTTAPAPPPPPNQTESDGFDSGWTGEDDFIGDAPSWRT